MNEADEERASGIIEQIESHSANVRKYINRTRAQADLLTNLDNWNQTCSSLDTVNDTLYSISDYLQNPFPEKIGMQYITTYGLLQALFIQQDAMRNLTEAFNIEYEASILLLKIREIRNAATGHPTKNKVKGITYYNYISRHSMSKYRFTLMRSFEQGKHHFVDVDLFQLLIDQLIEIEISYNSLGDKLEMADKDHLNKFSGKLLVDIFDPGFGYLLSKVSEGIHPSNPDYVEFAIRMLESIRKMYKEFEHEL